MPAITPLSEGFSSQNLHKSTRRRRMALSTDSISSFGTLSPSERSFERDRFEGQYFEFHHHNGIRSPPTAFESASMVFEPENIKSVPQTSYSKMDRNYIRHLNDVMIPDKQLLDFKMRIHDRKDMKYGTRYCAQFCSGLSFVGMLFLLIIGTLIEIQPLYIKGIHPIDRSRQSENSMNDDENDQDSVEFQSNQADDNYLMHDHAKNAFKASALYFLTMVLSIIYVQNYNVISLNICKFLKATLNLRRHINNIYNKYRRMEYIDISETSSVVSNRVEIHFSESEQDESHSLELLNHFNRLVGRKSKKG